jgi:hypothetical protein
MQALLVSLQIVCTVQVRPETVMVALLPSQ